VGFHRHACQETPVTTTESPTRPQPSNASDNGSRAARPNRATRSTFAAVGFGLACVLACSLPLLVGGGAAAAIGAAFSGAGLLAAVLAMVAAGSAGAWVVRRRRARAASANATGQPGSCGADGC
jgi:hypothetical protein